MRVYEPLDFSDCPPFILEKDKHHEKYETHPTMLPVWAGCLSNDPQISVVSPSSTVELAHQSFCGKRIEEIVIP